MKNEAPLKSLSLLICHNKWAHLWKINMIKKEWRVFFLLKWFKNGSCEKCSCANTDYNIQTTYSHWELKSVCKKKWEMMDVFSETFVVNLRLN